MRLRRPVVDDADSVPDLEPRESGESRDKGESRDRGLLHYLGLALSGALLVLVLGLAALVIVIPAVVGGSALTVLTSSMAPKFPPGTLIVIKPTPVDEIRVGDVVTYQITSGQPAVISHRVISRIVDLDGNTTFITKGDNNDLADKNPIREIQVKGVLWYALPYLGWVNNAVNGEARPLVVPLVAGALFAYAMWMVIWAALGRRRRDSHPLATAGDEAMTAMHEPREAEILQYDPDMSAR